MYYFRVDGSAEIGIGHIMRSMSVAKALKEQEEIFFMCHNELSAKIIESGGFNTFILQKSPFGPEEVEEIREKTEFDDETVIILDSYRYDNEYVCALRNFAKVVCFDDIAERAFEANALINYNSYASPEMYEEKYDKAGIELPRLILGSEYIPLRDEFLSPPDRDFNKVKDILITTGGGDSKNLAQSISEKLLEVFEGKNINLHLVCGPLNPNIKSLEEFAKENKYIFIHKSVKNMAELMSRCDLAVSAAGSTCYELCAMGLPFVVFAYAQNQTGILEDMKERNAALWAGYISSDKDKDRIIGNIGFQTEKLLENKEMRLKMSEVERRLVDGNGARRLAQILDSL